MSYKEPKKPSAQLIYNINEFAYFYRINCENLYHIFFNDDKSIYLNPWIEFLKRTTLSSFKEKINLPNINEYWVRQMKIDNKPEDHIVPLDTITLFPESKTFLEMLHNTSEDDNLSLYELLPKLYKDYTEDPNWETNIKALKDPNFDFDFEQIKALFKEILESKEEDQLRSCIELIKRHYNIDFHYFLTLKTLFKGDVQDTVDDYIKNQIHELDKIDPYDTNAINDFKKTCHIIDAIRMMLKENLQDDDESSDFRIKTQQLKQHKDPRNMILLAEQLNRLPPKKIHAINQALSKLLHDNPTITFQHIVDKMRQNEDDVKDLKKAMGQHRNLFFKLCSYFYPIQTRTMRFFTHKIQNQTDLTDEDIGNTSQRRL